MWPVFQRLRSVLRATGGARGPGWQTHPVSGRDGGDVLLRRCHDSRHETPGLSTSTSSFPAKNLTMTGCCFDLFSQNIRISQTVAY